MSAKKSFFSGFMRGLFSAPSNEVVQPEPIALQHHTGPTNGKKVLVVDDDPLFQKVMTQRLKASGYVVLNAIDGSEAITAMREEKPDAVLLDINFPPDISNGGSVHWDGLQLMNWIRVVEGRAQIPMFIITSDDIKLYEAKAASGGAYGVFFKPLDQKRLVSLVNRVLEEQIIAA